jgi:DNA modification methylase
MAIKSVQPEESFAQRGRLLHNWRGSALKSESTLHQLSPYIGKIKSSMAASLIAQFTHEGELVYDPFSGSGTVALEAWLARRRVIANDLSPYAALLSRAKLFPYISPEKAFADIEQASKEVSQTAAQVDLRFVPKWVRQFFHLETLRETLAWVAVLKNQQKVFLLSCLLGILHHQRPGFLSYPSSHTVPYLRLKRFPRNRFPKLYAYRSVRDRLEAKVNRATKRTPALDLSVFRRCYSKDAASFVPTEQVDAIITSPPYMRQLDYGRDNRLRLWFLGTDNWKALDKDISPSETGFLELMRRSLACWRGILQSNGRCVLILGDKKSRIYKMSLADAITAIALNEVGGYSLEWKHKDSIPDIRRVRRNCRGSLSETIIVLNKN